MPITTSRVAIVSGVRTPIGRAGKAYADVHPADLLGVALQGALDASGVDDVARIDQALVGCVYQAGDQAVNVGRNAWLAAGLPYEVPASTIDTQCGSSQQAVNLGAALIMSGQAELVVAGGVESLGRVAPELSSRGGSPHPASLRARYAMPHQGLAGEVLARKYGVTRDESDAVGLRSHLSAAAAWDAGLFKAQSVEVEVAGVSLLDRDQGIRADSSVERLAGLNPAFDPDGVITAGSASQFSDGAAALVLASERAVESLGLQPLAWVRRVVMVGVDPDVMLEGPIVATHRLLEAEGLSLDNCRLVEVHEAFATVVCAWRKVHQVDDERLNVNGGAISMGHPFGASGTRQLVDLAHALRAGGGGIGLSVMCCAGGIGTGTLIETA